MKKIIFYSTTILSLIFASCNDEAKKLERQYGALLQKEYVELENSDRYKLYMERYALLTDLSKQVYDSQEIAIDSPQKVDTLCFIPAREEDLQIDQRVGDQIAQKKDARPFSELINLSKEVNATIIAEGFHTKETGAPAFEPERDYHLIANILNPEEYFGNRLADTVKLYQSFCDDRILMDRINNSRYILIQKDLVNADSQYDEKSNKNEFTSGTYVGVVYVYDIQDKKFIHSIPIGGTNSDVVEDHQKSIEFSINSDLYKNISEALEQGLSEKFGLKGNVPDFYKP